MSSLFGSSLWGAPLFGGAPIIEPEVVSFSIDDRTITNATWIDARTIALASYGMTQTGIQIRGIVKGDGKVIRRTYTGLPSGATVSSAKLLLKNSSNDADADALFVKSISASLGADGEVTDATTTSDGSLGMDFILSPANTGLTTIRHAVEYPYFIRLILTDSIPHTLEVGTMQFLKV